MDNSEQKIEMKENCAEQIVETKNDNAELEKQAMEASSSIDNKNASADENGQEQKSIKKRIKFGGWLPDVLDWFKRPELAKSSLSTSSYIFNRYCWPKLHGKVKPYNVRKLTFSREYTNNGGWHGQTILENDRHIRIPIADIKPPEYIIGFEQIYFKFINDRVSQFVDNILPLLNEVKINFLHEYLGYNAQIGPTKHLMEMLPPKTNKLKIGCDFNEFDRQFPNFIPGLQSISILNFTETDMDLVMKWLTAPMEDGKTKMLKIYAFYYRNAKALINRVKEEFIHSTEAANFIICMGEHFEDFKIENETTKEMLELQRKGPNKYFLVRHKNDTKITAKVDDWEEEMKLKSNTEIEIMIYKYWDGY